MSNFSILSDAFLNLLLFLIQYENQNNSDSSTVCIRGSIWMDTRTTVNLELYYSTDLNNPIRNTSTNNQGIFIFNNLEKTCYVVKIIIPSGYYIVSDLCNSLFNPETGLSDPICPTDCKTPIVVGINKICTSTCTN